MGYDWPGNVRELAHFADRVALRIDGPAAPARQIDEQEPLPKRLERYEETLTREALAAHNGDVQATIEALGILRKTFYEKMQRHGISRADYRSNGLERGALPIDKTLPG